VRDGEKTTRWLAPKSARNFIALRALSRACCRADRSSSGPFQEIVTTFKFRFDISCSICAAVNPYLLRMPGKFARRMPGKPVSFITSRMLVNGTGGK
jgi:hypothetical protein